MLCSNILFIQFTILAYWSRTLKTFSQGRGKTSIPGCSVLGGVQDGGIKGLLVAQHTMCLMQDTLENRTAGGMNFESDRSSSQCGRENGRRCGVVEFSQGSRIICTTPFSETFGHHTVETICTCALNKHLAWSANSRDK